MRWRFPLLFLAAASVVSCSSSQGGPGNGVPGNDAGDPPPGDSAAAPDGYVGCIGQTDTYSANMQKVGAAPDGGVGAYTYTLVQASPAPPGLHENAWTMKITDATGASPDVSQLTAYPYMPQMRHGTVETPEFMANGDGSLAVSKLLLFMPGIWTVTFTTATPLVDSGAPGTFDAATEGGGTGPTSTVIDRAVFTFCISN